ncbi:MAG: NYN domain-containing protein [Lentisphaeria bacterium]|nr:NYN domain-containing protein [Lentisphaeria bacterium]
MDKPDSPKRIAVLIDAENTALSTLKAVLEVIAGKGHITLQRAYGDWSKDGLKKWRDVLNEKAIQPVHHFACTKGKNASDGAMIIGAMDLLYTKEFDAFALVTSDSDFTILASRLRASGLWVIGLGEKKTPAPFMRACNDFVLTDSLAAAPTTAIAKPAEAKGSNSAKGKPASPPAKTASPAKTTANAESKNEAMTPPQPPLSASPSQKESVGSKAESATAQSGVADVSEIIPLLKAAWEERQKNGWVDCCSAAAFVKSIEPDFNPKSYGVKKFSDLITSHPDVFKFHKSPDTPTGRFLFRPQE